MKKTIKKINNEKIKKKLKKEKKSLQLSSWLHLHYYY